MTMTASTEVHRLLGGSKSRWWLGAADPTYKYFHAVKRREGESLKWIRLVSQRRNL